MNLTLEDFIARVEAQKKQKLTEEQKVVVKVIHYYALGREKATPAGELRQIVNATLHRVGLQTTTERRFREIYAEELPVMACDQGIFIANEKEDQDEFAEYLRAKAIALFERLKRARQIYPEWNPSDIDPIDKKNFQLDLF